MSKFQKGDRVRHVNSSAPVGFVDYVSEDKWTVRVAWPGAVKAHPAHDLIHDAASKIQDDLNATIESLKKVDESMGLPIKTSQRLDALAVSFAKFAGASEPTPEAVTHPAHYGGDTTYEAIKVIEAWGLGFALGNLVKYVARAGKKDPAAEVQDLRKAAFYLDRRIQQLEAGE